MALTRKVDPDIKAVFQLEIKNIGSAPADDVDVNGAFSYDGNRLDVLEVFFHNR